MNLFTPGLLTLILKRIYAQRGLMLLLSLAVLTAISLAMSIPIYADGAFQQVLERNIEQADAQNGASEPAFAFLFRYLGSMDRPAAWDRFEAAHQYLSRRVPVDLNLKPVMAVWMWKTVRFGLYASEAGDYKDFSNPLAYISFGVYSDLEDHIRIEEGRFPSVSPNTDEPVEVLVHANLADKLGLQAGETLTAFRIEEGESARQNIQFAVRVAGVWTPSNTGDPYWFYKRADFENILFTQPDTMTGRLVPGMGNTIDEGSWYWVMDPTTVESGQVGALLGRVSAVMRSANRSLPNTRLDISPVDSLKRYRQSSQILTLYLYAISIPLFFMILVFINLVMGQLVHQRRNEIAMLRSRGSTAVQITILALIESLILSVLIFFLSIPAAQAIAGLFARTRSFMVFSPGDVPSFLVPKEALQAGAAMILITVVAQLIPTINAAGQTIVSYKREFARQLKPAWWKRAWVDVLLLIPVVYSLYLLNQERALPLESQGAAGPNMDPLMMIIPALAAFTGALLLLRILPVIMVVIRWLAARTNSVAILMASRYLAGSTASYFAPIILLVMTFSLSTYIATVAQTLDSHLVDQYYYQVGADIAVTELGERETSGQPGPPDISSNLNWVFLPVSEHLEIPGVEGATRVARLPVRINQINDVASVTYIGIDWNDFLKVAFWRSDFSDRALGDLMNQLGLTQDGVLISRQLAEANALTVGDNLMIEPLQINTKSNISMTIVGIVDYFPTWYPSEGAVLVGNLDYFFQEMGTDFPYDVWLKIAPNSNHSVLLQDIRDRFHYVLSNAVTGDIITVEAQRPERQGFFGVLSVGFTAMAFMTVVGFLIYALFSFRRRFVDLGILRTMGLSIPQTLLILAAEQVFLFLFGLLAGSWLGIWMSNWLIPSLQWGTSRSAMTPPFIIDIDWLSIYRMYLLFGVLFVVVLVLFGSLLTRMRLFQTIKMGESI